MRYLAVDLGDKRTGLAVGDSVTRIVTALDVVEVPIAENEGGVLLSALARRIEAELGRGTLVFGLPLNMDGTEGPRAAVVRAFAARLGERTGLAVEFQDERLTSAEADWSMARSGLTHRQKKQRRDAIAAAAILRDYLARIADQK